MQIEKFINGRIYDQDAGKCVNVVNSQNPRITDTNTIMYVKCQTALGRVHFSGNAVTWVRLSFAIRETNDLENP